MNIDKSVYRALHQGRLGFMNEGNFKIFNSRKYRKGRGAIHTVPRPDQPHNKTTSYTYMPPRLTNKFILWQMQWGSFYIIELGLNSWYDGFRESAFGQKPLHSFLKRFFIWRNPVIFSSHTCVWYLKNKSLPVLFSFPSHNISSQL